jgi:hypothetical protein
MTCGKIFRNHACKLGDDDHDVHMDFTPGGQLTARWRYEPVLLSLTEAFPADMLRALLSSYGVPKERLVSLK